MPKFLRRKRTNISLNSVHAQRPWHVSFHSIDESFIFAKPRVVQVDSEITPKSRVSVGGKQTEEGGKKEENTAIAVPAWTSRTIPPSRDIKNRPIFKNIESNSSRLDLPNGGAKEICLDISGKRERERDSFRSPRSTVLSLVNVSLEANADGFCHG